MKRLIPISLILMCFSLEAFASVSPGQRKLVELSNDNPNRFICVNGNINEVLIPAHIPHDLQVMRDHAFVTYKMKRRGDKIEYVTIPHDINIVCDGEVYTMDANPKKTNGGTAVKLGNPQIAELTANAKRLQELSIEDIMVEMFLDAYNENLPPNYAVQKEEGSVQVNPNIKANMRRSVALNGVGLRLKEYIVESDKEMMLDKRMFLSKDFSKKLRAVVVIPEVATATKPARLFVIEDK